MLNKYSDSDSDSDSFTLFISIITFFVRVVQYMCLICSIGIVSICAKTGICIIL